LQSHLENEIVVLIEFLDKFIANKSLLSAVSLITARSERKFQHMRQGAILSA
jgi:hypothetical protein